MALAAPAIVGVDGCPAGWIAVFREADGDPLAKVFTSFAALTEAFPAAITAVGIPVAIWA